MPRKSQMFLVGLFVAFIATSAVSGKDTDGDKKKEGKCFRACTMEHKPVCGTDDKTYGNKCLLKVAMCMNESLAEKHPGICKEPCEKACTREYRPHCGSDQRTYGNKCTFEVAQCKNQSLKLLYARECGSHEGICPKNRKGECGKKCNEDKDCSKTEKCCPSKCGGSCSEVCRGFRCPKCTSEEKQKVTINEDGCPVCKCEKLCRPRLCRKCPHGYKKDKFGCPNCRCKKRPPCRQRLCYRPCFRGYILDKDGCPTCRCRPRAPCAIMRCPPKCKSGRRKMVPTLFGCYRCSCLTM